MAALISEFVSYSIVYVMTVAFAIVGALLGIKIKKNKSNEE